MWPLAENDISTHPCCMNKEEAGISAPLEHVGVLLFVSEGSDWAFHIEIYRADEYTGMITESVNVACYLFSCGSLTFMSDLKKCDRNGSRFPPMQLMFQCLTRYPMTRCGMMIAFGCRFFCANVLLRDEPIFVVMEIHLQCRNGGSASLRRGKLQSSSRFNNEIGRRYINR
jgi:hypothetical protein